MNIAMIHFRVGATDGVSLEMDKWKENLEKLGHKVIYIAAEANQAEAQIVKEMSIYSEKHKKFFRNCYESLDDYASDDELIKDIHLEAKKIEDKLRAKMHEHQIEMIIPNNVSSLGLNLAVGIAISNLIEGSTLKVLYHHHDFYWERERYSHPTSPKIKEILETYFPNNKQNAVHCVINKIAQKELKNRKQLNGIVVPNVFDFTQDVWSKDEYNKDFRELYGIKDNDILFLQATRIDDRKAIELAIDTVEVFNKNLNKHIGKTLYNGEVITSESKVYLMIAGLNELRKDKFKKLLNKVDEVSYEVIFSNDRVESMRNNDLKHKTYALWDIYTAADFITYPSILEGWGNQFLEAVFAHKPLLIFEYPVYLTDIKKFGFDIISLGSKYQLDDQGLVTVDKKLIEAASKQIEFILFDKKSYQSSVKLNFNIAKDALSYESLKEQLKTIIDNNTL